MDEQKKYTLENGLSFLMKTSKKNERWCAGLFLASFAALNFPAELISAEFPDRLWAALLQQSLSSAFSSKCRKNFRGCGLVSGLSWQPAASHLAV